MRVPRTVGLLLLAAVLVGCGASQNASVTVGDAPRGPPATVVATPAPGANGDAMVVSGPGAVPLTPLGRRTTGSVTLRTFSTPPGEGGGCPANGDCAPAWCASTKALVIELSTPAMAAVLDSQVIGLGPNSSLSVLGTYGGGSACGGVSYPTVPEGDAGAAVPPGEGSQGAPATVGIAEGDPVQVVAVRVASAVVKVTLRTSHGADSAAPVDGLAVLAVEGEGSSGSLTATDDHGRTVASLSDRLCKRRSRQCCPS